MKLSDLRLVDSLADRRKRAIEALTHSRQYQCSVSCWFNSAGAKKTFMLDPAVLRACLIQDINECDEELKRLGVIIEDSSTGLRDQ